MRTRPTLAACCALALGSLPAWATSQNEQVRQGAQHHSSPSKDDGTSSGSSDNGTACDFVSCLCDLLGAVASAEPAVTVVDGPPPSGMSSAPPVPQYEVPPPVEEPLRGLAMLGIGRPLTKNLTVVPRAEAHVDLPLERSALRFGLEHELFMERVPAESGSTPVPAHWDNLPLSTIRMGWIFRTGSWEMGPLAGVRLLWVGDHVEPGLDAGFRAMYEAPAWFFDAGVTAMVLGSGGLVGTEPAVRVGIRSGRAQLGVGWRHLQFWGEELIPYTGPEASLALRF